MRKPTDSLQGKGCVDMAYIELDRLRDEILYDPNYDSDTVNHFLSIVDSQPAADVVEVKHGYWKRQKGRPEAICSECGREVVYQTIDNKWWFENYCPHCGADMRKKEGAET